MPVYQGFGSRRRLPWHRLADLVDAFDEEGSESVALEFDADFWNHEVAKLHLAGRAPLNGPLRLVRRHPAHRALYNVPRGAGESVVAVRLPAAELLSGDSSEVHVQGLQDSDCFT